MSSFRMNTRGIVNGLNNVVMRSQTALNLYADTVAKKLESEAKNNAPWTDRTGSARQRLSGTYRPVGAFVTRVELSHGVDYGYYLEFCHDQQNEILGITVQRLTPQIVRGMSNLLR